MEDARTPSCPAWEVVRVGARPGDAGQLMILDREDGVHGRTVCVVPGNLEWRAAEQNIVRLLDEDDIANAWLIRAAPELRAALQRLVRQSDRPIAESEGEKGRTYAAPWTVAPVVFRLLLEALEAWADQFDGPQDEDAYVSGTDLLEWFSDWRLRLRAALSSSLVDPIWAQARAALAAAKPPGGERRP